MFNSRVLRAPVVTLLSPSAVASQKAQALLHSLVGLEPVHFSVPLDDYLNSAFRSSLPGFSREWKSSASVCPSSGSLIHFCSIEDADKSGPFSMIGLTDSKGTAQKSVQNFRDLFASSVQDRSAAIKLRGSLPGNGISPMSLLKSISSGGLPLLQLPLAGKDTFSDTTHEDNASGSRLKEIVVPYFDNATFKDGSTFQYRISEASLTRPTVGVYQWTNSTTHVRPLPTAAEDQRLPPPSFIFQSSNLDDIFEKTNLGLKVAKIGYSGNKIGQLMMLHPDLEGIDIRYCSQDAVSSAFCEAQESLLAASLEELQSANALLAGGEQGQDDKRLGNADCWVEVRANLKSPSGYWQRKGSQSKPRIAKIPDIPYE